jgi:hypothetical protein
MVGIERLVGDDTTLAEVWSMFKISFFAQQVGADDSGFIIAMICVPWISIPHVNRVESGNWEIANLDWTINGGNKLEKVDLQKSSWILVAYGRIMVTLFFVVACTRLSWAYVRERAKLLLPRSLISSRTAKFHVN